MVEHELNLNGAVAYHEEQFPPKNLDYSRLIHPVTRAADALARFDQMLKNMHNSEILLAPLRNQEAVISSRMEGTISNMDEILRYEADHGEDSSNPAGVRMEVIETILYRRALTAAQKLMEDGHGVSPWLMRSIHAKLLSLGRGAEKSPGQFKTEQNYIVDKTKTKVLFIPRSPEKLIDGIECLVKYIAESEEQILIKTAISHVEFEALHPFKDGNGRIGRMLITLMLWYYGVISAPHFYISGYFEENKDSYIDSMRRVSEAGDWTGWCSFFLKAVEEQAIRNLKVAESIRRLYDEMKAVFRDILSSQWHVAALDFVFTNPKFRNNKFTSSSGIPSATAARFARILVARGLLVTEEEHAGRRPALYSFDPLMRLLRV
jgi:Fic family protein